MIAAALLGLAIAASPVSARPDPVLDALRTEADRSLASLRMEGFEKPYYLSASVVERLAFTVEAAGPALLPPRQGRQRWLRVVVRVGSHDLDNSGFSDQMGGRGSGETVTAFPLDDDPVAMRRALWIAFDDAFKEAGATFAAKRAFLATQGESAKESTGDFTREKPRRELGATPTIAADLPRVEPLLRRLTAALAAPGMPSSRVRISLVERKVSFVDTEGSELVGGSTFAALEAAAWNQADDGMPVRDLVMRYAPGLDGLGRPEALEAAIAAMAASVQTQLGAPVLAESYHGPVLFEGDASAQLFGTLLLGRLAEPREPLSAVGGGGRGAGGQWGSRVGSRVIASELSVKDDPGLTTRGGIELTGGYRFDFDGIFAQPVTLIASGVLKDFIGTRWPRKGYLNSNGHARRSGGAPWNLGSVAMPSNVVVSAGDGAVSAAEARRRFLEQIKLRELPFGIVVRRLDDSSILDLGATDWLETSDFQGRVHESSELEMPVALYRVTPEGKEERLRGARFGAVPVESLREILAVTPPTEREAVYNSLLTFDLGYTLTGPVTSSYLPLSVIAPGVVVLEEAELKPIPGPFTRRPLAAARKRAAAK